MSTTQQASLGNPIRSAPHVLRVFGDFRFHCDGDLLALTFTSDGGLLSVEEPGTLRQWDAASGQQRAWHFLSDLETLWVFGPDGRVLASASDDLSLWDASSGTLLTAVPQLSWVTALAFGKDPTHLATGHDDGRTRLWDAAGHQLLREFAKPDRPISALAFSPDGTRLAAAAEDKVVYLWEVSSGRLLGTFQGHTDRIHALAWHPQGQRLVTAGWDTTARVWDTATFEPIILLNSHATQVTALAFDRSGELLACADSHDAIHVWDFAASKVRHVLQGHKDQIQCLAFSADGKVLASGGADRIVRLWDLRQTPPPEKRQRTAWLPDLDGLHRGWTAVALGRSGTRLAGTCGGTALMLWPLEAPDAGPLVADGEGLPHAVAFSPDGRWLASGGIDARLRLWEAATGKLQTVIEDPDHKDPVTVLAFSADSRLLASAGATGTSVWLWSVPEGEPVLLIPDALDGCAVEALAFHPHRPLLAVGGIDWLATGGSDGAVSLWDIQQRAEVALFEGGTTSLAFNPAGTQLAAATLADSICLWDWAGQQLTAELTGHEGTITCVAYSPEGRWLASGSADRTLRLWDSQGGQARAVVELDTQVKTLTFSPDGRFLFTGNGNTTCYQLDLQRLLSQPQP